MFTIEELSQVVYEELRRIARSYMRHERRGHTLQPTAIVNEACLRMHGGADATWKDETHFRAVAALTMRHVLVDHARKRRLQGQSVSLGLEDPLLSEEMLDVDVLELDDALERLRAKDSRAAQMLEYRYFGGLSNQHIASLLSVTARTVRREIQYVHSWMLRELRGAPSLLT